MALAIRLATKDQRETESFCSRLKHEGTKRSARFEHARFKHLRFKHTVKHSKCELQVLGLQHVGPGRAQSVVALGRLVSRAEGL